MTRYPGLKPRELYGKRSLLELATGAPVQFYDIHLDAIKPEAVDEFCKVVADPATIYSWVKKDHVTVVECDGCDKTWQELLDVLHIECTTDPKADKRRARAFSPRDCVIPDYLVGTVIDVGPWDDKQDGVMRVKRSWLVNAMLAIGEDPARLRGVKRISLTVITPDGTIKGVAYICDGGKYDICTSKINIKPEMYTTDGEIYISFDFQYKYKNPKSNSEADVMLGRMLYTRKQLARAIDDTLGTARDNIFAGTSCNVISDWGLPELNSKAVSTKVNEDFAALPDMARDMAQRGVDEREFPGLISLVATGVSNQFRQIKRKKEWARYPLPCVWNRPVLSETAAALIDCPITVAPGTIRAIRNGDVWVVNDDEWISDMRMNSGGGDFDDDWNMYFRMIPHVKEVIVNHDGTGEGPEFTEVIENVKSIIFARNPMGWKEFTVLRYVEDEFVDNDSKLNPSFTDRKGNVCRWPVLPGRVPTTLTEDIASGAIRFEEMPELETASPYDTYGAANVTDLITELVCGETGNVGMVINAIILAAAVRPSLLAVQVATMEDIVDTFTQGGGTAKRVFLTEWAENLLEQIANDPNHEIDPKLWARRAGRTELGAATMKIGFFSWFEAYNIDRRGKFVEECRVFAQSKAREGGVVIAKMEKMFGATRKSAPSITTGVLPVAQFIVKEWRSCMKLRNDIAKAEFEQELRQHPYLDQDDWKALYEDLNSLIVSAAGPDQMRQEYLMLAVWFMSMSMPTRRGYSDKCVWNTRMWPLFIQGMVHFGLAKDLEREAANRNPWRRLGTGFTW